LASAVWPKRRNSHYSCTSVGEEVNASYPEAFATSVKEDILPRDCKLRRVKYLSNVIEQDHRAIRRRWRAMQCVRSFYTAERTLEGIESMHMMREGQVKRLDGRYSIGQMEFVASLFGVAA
jgi:transposase-like protein